MDGFSIWSCEYRKGWAVVRGPEDIKRAHQLTTGMSRADGWPPKVVCRMSDDYPKDVSLTDSLLWLRLRTDLQTCERRPHVRRCKKLVIQGEAVPRDRLVFRPKHAPFVILVRSALAKSLEEAKLTGLAFRSPAAFRGA